MYCLDLSGTEWGTWSTTADEGQGGRLGPEQVRTRGLPLAAIFIIIFCSLPVEPKFP